MAYHVFGSGEGKEHVMHGTGWALVVPDQLTPLFQNVDQDMRSEV
jgi:hypothetical protein